jgi:glycosyltransferase involved in cell wall biosynthesis
MVFDEHIYRCVLKRKGEIIPNSIDIKKIKNLAEEHVISKNYSLFFLGRLCEEKDPFFFIDLAANLSRVTSGFSAALIGDGPLYSSCRAKIEELNMRNNIEMYGFLRNPYPLLKNASILVMPSRWEGFGLVALEAMCLGVPVLARPVGGLKSIISESGGGFLCDTTEQFIERASKILRDSEFRQKIGEKGQSWVSENLAYSTYLDKFRKIYTLNGRGKR